MKIYIQVVAECKKIGGRNAKFCYIVADMADFKNVTQDVISVRSTQNIDLKN